MFANFGDRHWRYSSIAPNTGLSESSCRPASDQHAAGCSKELRKDMQRFLRIKGGFLRVDLDSARKII